ncbi:hypothetical protein AB6G22_13125 [Providencia hangzhouensis]|uniref:hypothetical protein n=1 Tax=Providencia hangzhouensis TaxID=3031799 RepID=UPI0034DD190E
MSDIVLELTAFFPQSFNNHYREHFLGFATFALYFETNTLLCHLETAYYFSPCYQSGAIINVLILHNSLQ